MEKKEGTLTTYCDVASFLLETYSTDIGIAEIDAEILRSTHPSNMTSTEYTEALWKKALPCHCVYDEYMLKGMFIEGLIWSIRRTMWSYWSSEKDASIHDLARHLVSLTNLQWDRVDRAHQTLKKSQTSSMKTSMIQRAPQSRRGSPTSTKGQWRHPQYSCSRLPVQYCWYIHLCITRVLGTPQTSYQWPRTTMPHIVFRVLTQDIWHLTAT